MSQTRGNTPLTGTKAIADNSIKAYEFQMKGLQTFLALTRDYESMLILLLKAPKNVISINAESIYLYVQYKYSKKGTTLKTHDGHQKLDILGNSIEFDGGWNAPICMTQFFSAVSAVHKAREHRGKYVDLCKDCLALPSRSAHRGCKHHLVRPHNTRRGDSSDSQILEDLKAAEWKRLVDWEAKGDTPLLPEDICQLQSILLSTNCINDLQFYVIILLAIRLFLCHDEFYDIDLSQFALHLFTI